MAIILLQSHFRVPFFALKILQIIYVILFGLTNILNLYSIRIHLYLLCVDEIYDMIIVLSEFPVINTDLFSFIIFQANNVLTWHK